MLASKLHSASSSGTSIKLTSFQRTGVKPNPFEVANST